MLIPGEPERSFVQFFILSSVRDFNAVRVAVSNHVFVHIILRLIARFCLCAGTWYLKIVRELGYGKQDYVELFGRGWIRTRENILRLRYLGTEGAARCICAVMGLHIGSSWKFAIVLSHHIMLIVPHNRS